MINRDRKLDFAESMLFSDKPVSVLLVDITCASIMACHFIRHLCTLFNLGFQFSFKSESYKSIQIILTILINHHDHHSQFQHVFANSCISHFSQVSHIPFIPSSQVDINQHVLATAEAPALGSDVPMPQLPRRATLGNMLPSPAMRGWGGVVCYFWAEKGTRLLKRSNLTSTC